MTKFVFKLDPALRQRELAEEKCLRVVAEIETERVALEGKLRTCQQQIEGSREDMRSELQTGRRVDGIRMQAAAGLFAAGSAHRLAVALAGVMTRLDRSRDVLREAVAARMSLEKLRERAHDEWRREQLRREQVELDDIATSRWRSGEMR